MSSINTKIELIGGKKSIMLNVYDFDKTIYDGDSSIDFYLFCLKRKKSIILLLTKQVFAMILYKLKIKYFKRYCNVILFVI